MSRWELTRAQPGRAMSRERASAGLLSCRRDPCLPTSRPGSGHTSTIRTLLLPRLHVLHKSATGKPRGCSELTNLTALPPRSLPSGHKRDKCSALLLLLLL